MSASQAPWRHGRVSTTLRLGLVAVLALPVGCGGPSGPADTGTTNPKAAEHRRDMENFMKTQQK